MTTLDRMIAVRLKPDTDTNCISETATADSRLSTFDYMSISSGPTQGFGT
jgi:hypothetical protein